MATNNAIWKEIQKLKANWGVRDDSTLYNMLSNEQKRVFLKKSPGVKRVVPNTAPVVPAAATAAGAPKAPESLSNAEKEKVRFGLVSAVSRSGKTPEAYIETLDTPLKKDYARELLAERTNVPGAVPLRNCGNSCYINAEIQFLYLIPEFKELLKTNIEGWQEKKVSALDVNPQKSRNLLRNLNSLFAAMNSYSAVGIPFNANHVFGVEGKAKKEKDALEKKEKVPGQKPPKYSTLYDEIVGIMDTEEAFSQEDAGEFMIALFQNLFTLCFLLPLKNKFRFLLESRLFCEDETIRPEPKIDVSYLLQIEINEAGVNDVQTALNEFQRREVLVGEDRKLQACAKPPSPTGMGTYKQLTIQVPDETKYAIINLKRYDWGGSSGSKLIKHIRLNPQITIGGVRFQLKTAVTHLGNNLKSGHYVTYRFDESGNPIVVYNDSTVTSVRGENYHNTNILTGALIILYERIGAVAEFGGFQPFSVEDALLRTQRGELREDLACLYGISEEKMKAILDIEIPRANAMARRRNSPENVRTLGTEVASAAAIRAAARAPTGGRSTRKHKKRSRKTRRN